jgi:hypothetical protein
MAELIRTAVAPFTGLVEPWMAAQSSASGKIRAYLVG